MPGAGRKTFIAGEKLRASEVNNYLQDQVVMRFASASARLTALPTPSEGMVTYLDDTNEIYSWDGSEWNRVGNAKIYIQNTAPASGQSGDLWWDADAAILYAWFDVTSQWVTVTGGGTGTGGGIEMTFLLMGA